MLRWRKIVLCSLKTNNSKIQSEIVYADELGGDFNRKELMKVGKSLASQTLKSPI